MACKYCHKIRSLLLHGKMAEAAGVTVEKLRESIGWKEKEKPELTKGGELKGTPFAVGEIAPESFPSDREFVVPLKNPLMKGALTPDAAQESHPELSARPETTKRKPKP